MLSLIVGEAIISYQKQTQVYLPLDGERAATHFGKWIFCKFTQGTWHINGEMHENSV